MSGFLYDLVARQDERITVIRDANNIFEIDLKDISIICRSLN